MAAVVFPKTYTYDDYDAKRMVYEDNPVDNTFLSAINEFSYKTASQIVNDSTKNINYSPVSLYFSLALAASGSGGETSRELTDLLGGSDKSILSVQCQNYYIFSG